MSKKCKKCPHFLYVATLPCECDTRGYDMAVPPFPPPPYPHHSPPPPPLFSCCTIHKRGWLVQKKGVVASSDRRQFVQSATGEKKGKGKGGLLIHANQKLMANHVYGMARGEWAYGEKECGQIVAAYFFSFFSWGEFRVCVFAKREVFPFPLHYLHCRLPNTEVGYWSSHIDPTRASTQVAILQPTTANFPQISLLLLLREEIQIFPLTEYNDGFGAPGLFVIPQKCLCRHFEGKDANIAFFPAWWIFA